MVDAIIAFAGKNDCRLSPENEPGLLQRSPSLFTEPEALMPGRIVREDVLSTGRFRLRRPSYPKTRPNVAPTFFVKTAPVQPGSIIATSFR